MTDPIEDAADDEPRVSGIRPDGEQVDDTEKKRAALCREIQALQPNRPGIVVTATTRWG